jgi:hypothetical protein
MVAQIDSNYRQYGFGRLARRLASYAFFEGRPATTRGQWFNPVVFAWLRLLQALPGSPSVSAPIFITGLGRSGTTILGILLSLHKDVGFLNEPKAIWHLIDPRQDLNANYNPEGGQYRLAASEVTPGMKRRAHRLFARYLAVTGAHRVVDKYPEMIFRLDYLLNLFPDARIIFITRNGTDAVPSVVKWSERMGTSRDGILEDWWGRDDAKWRYLREQVILADPQYRTVWEVATPDLNHADRAALEWITSMREGLAQQKLHPDSVMRVAYEDLLAQPQQTLTALQRHCGLTPDEAVVDYARGRLYDNPAKGWPALNPAVDDLFRQTMGELGYV